MTTFYAWGEKSFGKEFFLEIFFCLKRKCENFSDLTASKSNIYHTLKVGNKKVQWFKA
jgi:hypothetical protein